MLSFWLALLVATLAFRHLAGAAECGVPGSLTRIVGGETVNSLRYPWYVALVSPSAMTELSVSCGGSLITSRHVLTAAHCFPTDMGVRPEQLYRAVFQLLNRCGQTDAASGTISRVDISPSYSAQTLRGDLAVLTLSRAVPYTPVCLPARNAIRTGDAYIIGFGSTLAKSQYPCTLQEAKVTILSRRQCVRSSLAAEFSQVPGTFCAGVLRGGVDSCDGDSGGPLLTMGSSGTYTIQGIVSFGEGCARKNLPGVYTQVSAYRDFIDKTIQSSSSSEDVTTEEATPSPPPSQSSPTLLQGLLQGLLHPWADMWAPTSSSGAGGASAAGDSSAPGGQDLHRPFTPLQVILQGLFGRHRRRNCLRPRTLNLA